ncbi:MAG: hypothetical protein QME06_08465 [Desulfobacterales bacterium]|nr:hypothetical protein [Desulfobacterales bacterium]
MGRIEYIQSLKNWHQQYPLRMYIIYGVNTFTRTAAHLGRPFLPFKVEIAQDFNHALDIIRRDKLGDSAKEQKHYKVADSPKPNQDNIEKLLAFIGSINLEQEGVDSSFNFDEQHPFYILFQSIKLIKEELDSLFDDHKKATENLQNSNAKLQMALSELKQTRDKMVQQERLAAVGQLSAGIAHDFNNILSGILVNPLKVKKIFGVRYAQK